METVLIILIALEQQKLQHYCSFFFLFSFYIFWRARGWLGGGWVGRHIIVEHLFT